VAFFLLQILCSTEGDALVIRNYGDVSRSERNSKNLGVAPPDVRKSL